MTKPYASGNSTIQSFVRHFALFITGFLKGHLDLLENGSDSTRAALSMSLSYLLRISEVDHHHL